MRSDTYTIMFTMIVAVILGVGLSTTADSLRERQNLNVELDIKKNILTVLGFDHNSDMTNEDIQSMYKNNISEIIINSAGEIIDNNISEQVTYKIYQSRDGNKITGYAIPIAGKGLWGTMYGYFAIEPDASTAKGITFYKHKETPGLGAEVDKDWFKNNFIGKKFIDDSGKLVSIEVIKGFVSEKDPDSKYKVDGISGATITGSGLTTFLKADLEKYEPYFSRLRNSNQNESS